MPVAILIVDDDPVQRRLLGAAVTRFGYTPLAAAGGAEALAALDGAAGAEISLVILDLVMPEVDGLAVLAGMRQRAMAMPVIVQTAQGGIDTAISAMRAGAFDFVVKPVSPERLQVAITNALKVDAREGAARRSRPVADAASFADLVGTSPAMARAVSLARKAAASNIPILIEGESGVGKELIARAIQDAGPRRGKPFVTVNCGAIPDNLVESILFGHEKGSFTGATDRHVGKFVEAHGGTLFLDEIGDLPLDVQVKLLRAVQEGEVDAVGARTSQKVDIRLISATHRNLAERVAEGRFREDLFYRLNVFPLLVPPLRDRREDIPVLVHRFAERFGREERGSKPLGVAPEAVRMLCAYDWPGNIRQLENAVFRAVVLAEGDRLTPDEFPQIRAQVEGIEVETPAVPVAPDAPEAGRHGLVRAIDERGNVRALAEVELEMIELAIDHYKGQMSEVARRLGVGRSTLYRKLKEHGIDPDRVRSERIAS